MSDLKTTALRADRILREKNGFAKTQRRNPQWPDDYDPEEIVNNPDSYPEEHVKIAEINLAVRDNPELSFTKCANCGKPYLVSEGSNDTVCSETCNREYLRYLMG